MGLAGALIQAHAKPGGIAANTFADSRCAHDATGEHDRVQAAHRSRE